jgi:uncharacterized RDD family membrane protein YckC
MASSPAPAIYCSQCGRAMPADQVIELAGNRVCAACKPALLRRMQEGAAAPARAVYKGFWIRFLAKVLDGIALDVVLIPINILILFPTVIQMQRQPNNPGAALGMMLPLFEYFGLAFVLTVTYNGLMVGKWGATLGKMAIGARVVTPEGAPVGYGRAFGRALAEIVTSLTLTIGYIIAGFDAQKRALHDHIAGTRVVAKA